MREFSAIACTAPPTVPVMLELAAEHVDGAGDLAAHRDPLRHRDQVAVDRAVDVDALGAAREHVSVDAFAGARR